MVSWGVAWANAKILGRYFDFYDLVFLRFFFGSLSLLPILFLTNEKLSFKIDYIKYIVPASTLFLLYNISFFMGTHYGEAGRGAVFATTTNPIITLLLMSIISRKINRYEVCGIALGLIGGSLIMDIHRSGISDMFNKSNIFFPICSFLWALITIFISYSQKKVPPFQFIFLCYFFTAIISSPFTSISYSELKTIDFVFYPNFFMVAIASMAFGTSVYMYASRTIGPIRSSVFIFSVPFIALISAKILLDEKIEPETVLGGIICIFAILIVNNKRILS
tara:strand:+ start:7769 stop:8602 length:834 start_codon:yes stop_codon:yes gene_type:complete